MRSRRRNSQKAKFKSILKYFDWLETADARKEVPSDGAATETNGIEGAGDDARNTIKISRKVMSAKQWLTIEDWLECGLPLCPLEIKHEGRIERAHENIVQAVFASPRLGGSVLSAGNSQVKFTWEGFFFGFVSFSFNINKMRNDPAVVAAGWW